MHMALSEIFLYRRVCGLEAEGGRLSPVPGTTIGGRRSLLLLNAGTGALMGSSVCAGKSGGG